MNLEIELGEVDVLIMGVHLSLRLQTHEQRVAVADTFADIVLRRLEENFAGRFEVSVVSVESGCIKVRLRLIWKGASELLTPPALFIGILAGTQALWGPEKESTEFTANGITCEAKYAGSNLIGGVHVTVRENESLGEIVNAFDRRPYSLNQVIVATFLRNRDQFIGNNMNRLPVGAVLILPTPAEIAAISDACAADLIEAHNRDDHTDA